MYALILLFLLFPVVLMGGEACFPSFPPSPLFTVQLVQPDLTIPVTGHEPLDFNIIVHPATDQLNVYGISLWVPGFINVARQGDNFTGPNCLSYIKNYVPDGKWIADLEYPFFFCDYLPEKDLLLHYVKIDHRDIGIQKKLIPILFSADYSVGSSNYDQYTLLNLGTVTIEAEEDACLVKTIEPAFYFWDDGEEGTVHFSVVNHCPHSFCSSEADGLRMTITPNYLYEILGVEETNASHYDLPSRTFYFNSLEVGESWDVTLNVKAHYTPATDVDSYGYFDMRLFQDVGCDDGTSWTQKTATTTYVCPPERTP